MPTIPPQRAKATRCETPVGDDETVAKTGHSVLWRVFKAPWLCVDQERGRTIPPMPATPLGSVDVADGAGVWPGMGAAPPSMLVGVAWAALG